MYLNINNSTYMVTSECNKPYLKIDSNNMLPLTTLSGGGQFKCKVGTSYSTSTEYLTTAIESSELQSITALTEVSTTGTSYETVASTTNTVYETIESTQDISYNGRAFSQYSLEYVNYYSSSTSRIYSGKFNQIASTKSAQSTITIYQGGASVRTITSFTTSTLAAISPNSISRTDSYSQSTRGYAVSSSTQSVTLNRVTYIHHHMADATSTSYSYTDGVSSYTRSIFENSNDGVLYGTTSFSMIYHYTDPEIGYISNYTNNYVDNVSITTLNAYTATTNTIYETVEATTATSYLTGEVTTAYSGYSSSSTSGGITTYRPLICKITSNTYYTSAIDSSGLIDVTALTSEVTTGTSYLTSGGEAKSMMTFIDRSIVSDDVYGDIYTTYTVIFPQLTSTNTSKFAGYTFLDVYNTNNPSGSFTSTQNSPRVRSGTGTTTVWINKELPVYNNFIYTNTTYVSNGISPAFSYSISMHVENNIITTGTSYLTSESTTGYSGISSSVSYSWE